MHAKERDLSFRQINRKMIRIFRNFVERELTDQVRSGTVTDDSVGLQLHWSIIEEFSGARQYLSNKSDPVISFHRFDLDIHIDTTSPEKKLTRRRSNAPDAGQHGLFKCIENERGDNLAEASNLRLHDRLE